MQVTKFLSVSFNYNWALSVLTNTICYNILVHIQKPFYDLKFRLGIQQKKIILHLIYLGHMSIKIEENLKFEYEISNTISK